MADFLFLEQLNKIMRQVPRPRLMYKKGIGAKGFFKPYMTFRDYTKAEIFQSADEIFPVKVRFSSMFGERGTSDTVRNIKGFSVRFCTEESKYDLICQSLPVYFINDEEKFFKLMGAFSKDYPFDGINSKNLWSFLIENPESVNCIVRLFSSRGLVESYTDIKWYSVNTYVWENEKGKKFLVRYKWKPAQNKKIDEIADKKRPMDRVFAEFMAGFDPDIASDTLKRNMEEGDFPSFELFVQIVDYKFISHPNYLKRTVCWNDNINPPVKVGILKLTDVIKEHGESGDSDCFAPGNIIPGISLCEDEFSKVMDYAHKIGGIERGAYL
ncbi:MAG: catalase [Anaerovoracaceae bacterium]